MHPKGDDDLSLGSNTRGGVVQHDQQKTFVAMQDAFVSNKLRTAKLARSAAASFQFLDPQEATRWNIPRPPLFA